MADLDKLTCWARRRMEIVGVFSTISLTFAILSSEMARFLPLLGCSDVVPVAMKF